MRIPILTYHSISNRPSVTSTPFSIFRRQIEQLEAAGYEALSFSQLDQHQKFMLRVPRVIITFDDAYTSIQRELEFLLESGLTATVFASSAACGGEADWPGADGKIMAWSSLRGWAESGIELGSHSVDHVDLTQLPQAQLDLQLSQSQRMIQDRTSRPCSVLAYPFGRHNALVRASARRYYKRAVTTRLAWAHPTSDPLALPRLDMYYFRRPAMWRHFDNSLGSLYLGLRSLGRRVKGL